MYQVVEQMIGHTWQTNYTGDQQYIYYICGSLICLLTVVFIDKIFEMFRRFTHG